MLSTSNNDNQVTIMLISNIILEPYFSTQLQDIFSHNNIHLYLLIKSYEDFIISEKNEDFKEIDTIILWLDYNTLLPDVYNEMLKNQKGIRETFVYLFEYFKEFINQLIEVSDAKILLFGFEDYSTHFQLIWGNVYSKYNIVDQLNRAIYEEFSDRIIVIDLQRLIAINGILNSLDDKLKYRWGNPYSQTLIREAAKEIYKQYVIANRISKKCIVLDCDNVLWGGILSEDGIENLMLGEIGIGRRFQDFQRFLLNLYFCGVILAVSSKNDLDDVLRMFRDHDGMILKEEHISCFRVNWDNKCDNIIKISEILNIGLDSIVFIDDSVFEIESVNAVLPMVYTILYDNKTVYTKLNCFNISPNVNYQTVQIRNETYRSDYKRQQLRSEYKTFDDYLENLRIKLTISKADELSLNRISELSQRTNKCTNGVRYTANELKTGINEGLQLFAVYVSDKFSNLGLVGAIGIQDNVLKLFCLSCRALGRNIEESMLQYVKTIYKIHKINFISTSKNNDLNNYLNQLLK